MKSKLIFVIVFCISKFTFSQNIILLDRQFQWTSYLSDSVNDKIGSEYFPIYKSELDSLIPKIEPLLGLTKMGLNKVYLDENKYSTGHLKFKIQNIEGAYGYRYDILLISNIENESYSLRLNHQDWTLVTNKQTIKSFLKQLEKIKKQVTNNTLKLYRH